MRRAFWLAGVVGFVAACGDAPKTAPSTIKVAPAEINASTARFASGPIATACLIHDRRGASKARCGCVQAAANLTLSQAQQQRSSRFFNEPELLQAIKLSDTPENERFWAVWAAFAETAEELCKGV
jgi:hypothetical protein